MKKPMQFLPVTGWLIPVGIALVFFGRWITETVVPPLKGGNFGKLYHPQQVRYLDIIPARTVVAFAWAGIAVCRWTRRLVNTP